MKDIARSVVNPVRNSLRDYREGRLQDHVAQALESAGEIRTYDSDELFIRLQTKYPARNTYKYDAFSVWDRGVKRAASLIELCNFAAPGRKILEIGCGDGMTGFALNSFGHYVTLADIENWLDPRAKSCPFLSADVCDGLPVPDESFDLVYSFNTFQHLAHPKAGFREMLRVCRPNGFISIQFNPLFASPWGLHAYRSIHMPYSQFIFSMEFISSKLEKLGIYDQGQAREKLLPLNRWTLSQFNELWQCRECTIVAYENAIDGKYLQLVSDFPGGFRGKNLRVQDLVTAGINVLLKKCPHFQSNRELYVPTMALI